LTDAVARDERRQKLQKEIASLENKVRKEKQFNRQVELNAELKRLIKELE
jgi:septal ring factor EnvC (AmiA/AmiB activator)